MIVRSIEINNKDTYIDLVIKELCKNNISYVYVKESNELHFDNYIFRFFENYYTYTRMSIPKMAHKIENLTETNKKKKDKDKDKKKKIIPEIILKKSYIPNQQNYPRSYL